MKTILDKEMPVRKKRYFMPVWFSILLLTGGFLTGYYFPESHVLQQATASSQANDMNFSDINQPAEKTTSPAIKPVPVENNAVKNMIIRKNPHKKKNLLPSLPKPIASEPLNNNETSDKTKPATDGITFEIKNKNTGVTGQISIMNNLRENEKPVSFLPSGNTIFIPCGNISIADVKKIKTQQLSRQLTINLGTGLFSPNLYSAGIAYNLLIENNGFTYGGGIGYRYMHTRQKEVVASGVLQDSQNMDGTALQGWELNDLHQIFLDVNLRYQIRKSWYFGGGVQFPFTLNSLNTRGYDFSANLESDPSNDPINNPGFSASGSSSEVRSWDIQPYISVGKRITSDLFLFSSIQAGLFPVNTVPLENKGKIRLNQITAGIHYKL